MVKQKSIYRTNESQFQKKIYVISSCTKMQKSIHDVNVFKFPIFILKMNYKIKRRCLY